ncbi:MAG TPA: hypothetical protein VJ909_02790 [Prolixibacteraceae bacterium]|nr:hypothetical protein [Prolixibacteraceae bacterium]
MRKNKEMDVSRAFLPVVLLECRTPKPPKGDVGDYNSTLVRIEVSTT